MDVKLVAQTGPARGQAIAVRAAKFFIGSHANCHLRPEIPGLAGIHALIEEREGRVMVRDFGSEGGTAINDRVLRAKEYEASDGDILKIGPMVLAFALGARAADIPTLEEIPLGWPLSEQSAAAAAPSKPAPPSPPPPAVEQAGPCAAELSALEYETVGDVLVVTLTSSELTDEFTVGPMRFELKGLLEQPLPRKVVINLGNVTFLSSRAVGVILANYQGLDRLGGKLRVCCVQPKVMPVLQQMRLNMLIEIDPTVEEAVQASWE